MLDNMQYDDSFVPGDLITMYSRGFYVFERYEQRHQKEAGGVPLVHAQLLYRDNGDKIKSKKIDRCDAGYCQRASVVIPGMISKKQAEIDKLQEILKNH